MKLKKMMAAVLATATLLFSVPTFAYDFSYLDDMDIEELTALQDEVSSRITDLKNEEAENNPDDYGMWEIKYYIDDFQNPTDEGYVTNTYWITGTFSNSATTNSKLNVSLVIDKEFAAIKLYEYGDNLVKNASSSSTDVYDIKMQDDAGEVISFRGRMYAGGSRIFMDDNYQTIVDA